ncbi:MAG: fibronectin type III domain-containing protein, partial [Boseongicola sp. SB0675_bin_26]|nr:fibronectin type III domain-containing protein [Boseongicola sp. SB0675_bin_26]
MTPVASCSAAVTGTAATLSGLTPGTAYTWKTYSDSTCTEANKLASVDFTTAAAVIWTATLTVGNDSEEKSRGYKPSDPGDNPGMLSPSTIAYGGATYTVARIQHTLSATYFQVTGTPAVSTDLKLCLDGTAAGTKAWLDGTVKSFTGGGAWVLDQTVKAALVESSASCPAGAGTKPTATLSASAVTSTSAKLTATSHPLVITLRQTSPTLGDCGAFDEDSLTPGTTYTVKSYPDGACAETPLASVTFTTPPAVTLAATDVTDISATLTIGEHTGQWWHRRTSPTPAGTCTAVGADTATASLTGLAANTGYTFKAYSDSGCTTELASVTFTTPPARVSNLKVASAKAALALSWDAATGATGYEVQWKSGQEAFSSSADPARHATTTGTSYTISGLEAWRQYTVRVRATAPDAPAGAWSGEGTLAASGLDKVTGVTVSAASAGNALDVGWTAVMGAARYVLTWKTAQEDYADAPSTSATGASHTIPGLTAGTEYMVVVQAVDASSRTGPRSDEAKGTPTAPAAALAAGDVRDTGATL